MQTPRSPGTPFARGEKVHGVRAEESSLLEEGKQWTLEKWRLLKDQVNQMLEESRSSAYRAELEDALAKAKVLAEDGAREIRQGAENLPEGACEGVRGSPQEARAYPGRDVPQG